jgi:hypothetical protein
MGNELETSLGTIIGTDKTFAGVRKKGAAAHFARKKDRYGRKQLFPGCRTVFSPRRGAEHLQPKYWQ